MTPIEDSYMTLNAISALSNLTANPVRFGLFGHRKPEATLPDKSTVSSDINEEYVLRDAKTTLFILA